MDHIANQEEFSFNDEETHGIIWNILGKCLATDDYNEELSDKWSNTICEDIIIQMTALNKPFKYMVNCILMQKNGAGLNSSISCFWDTGNDAQLIVQWPKANAKQISNPTVTAIVTLFAVKLS